MFSGSLNGGPLKGVMMHHPEPAYVIGQDRLTKHLYVGWQGGDTQDVRVGQYEYADGAWHWNRPNKA